jgi:peptidoglycan/LPS O-acetylase OafA/YrhL
MAEPSHRFSGLDGARGMLMALFILAHLGLTSLYGAWILLTCFFVVSGFLITSILIRQYQRTGRVGWWDFYRRRARRLIPALIALMVVVTTWALIDGTFDDKARMRGDLISTSFFVQNWRLISQQDNYFHLFSGASFFRHAWTLAVEEQFYIVSPFVIALLVALRSRRLRLVILGVGIAISAWIGASIGVETVAQQARVYYGTDTRISGILVGIALAFWWTPDRTFTRSRVDAVGWGGMALLVGASLVVTPMSPFMLAGGGLVLVALATVGPLIAMVWEGETSISRALSWRPLVWLGERVYGFYLWHWPIKLWLDRYVPDWPVALDILVGFGATALVAGISYRFLEAPIIAGGLRGWVGQRWARPVGVLALTSIVVSVVLLGRAADPARLAASVPPLVAGTPQYQPGDDTHDVGIFGDSVSVGLIQDLPHEKYSDLAVQQLGGIGCGVTAWTPLLFNEAPVAEDPECREAKRDLQQHVQDHHLKLVVMMGGQVASLPQFDGDGQVHAAMSQAHLSELDAGLDHLRNAARAGGAEFAIATVPCRDITGNGFAPEEQERVKRYIAAHPDEVADVNDPTDLNRHLQQWAQKRSVPVLDLYSALGCSKGFVAERAGYQMFKDELHFTPAGSAIVWTWLAPQIRSTLEGSTSEGGAS